MYHLKLLGMEIQDASLVHRVIRVKRQELDTLFGVYVCSGANIFMVSPLSEDVELNAKLNGLDYTILISLATETQVMLEDNFKNADTSMAQNLMNVIINQAFRETNLRQIGKRP